MLNESKYSIQVFKGFGWKFQGIGYFFPGFALKVMEELLKKYCCFEK